MKVLFIPDSPLSQYVRTRGEELARQIARKHEVYFLSWGRKDVGNLLSKISFRIQRRFTSKTECQYDKLTVVNSPHSDFEVASLSMVSRVIGNRNRSFNKKILRGIVRDKKIEVIVNQSRRMWDCTNLDVPFVYDVADLPYDGMFKGSMKNQMIHANNLMCISNYIQREIQKQLNLKSTLIPNGVDLNEFREAEGCELKTSSRKIVGFIGNHGWWSGLSFLLDFFKLVQNEFELWIVGDGSELPNAMKKVEKEGIKKVKFYGAVSKDDVVKYFRGIDIGVLPFKKTIFTDAAFPIKVLEYTAAKKFVLATDLEELKTLRLANLVLRASNEKLWAETIHEIENKKWNPEWNKEIEGYDWNVLGERVLTLLEEMT